MISEDELHRLLGLLSDEWHRASKDVRESDALLALGGVFVALKVVLEIGPSPAHLHKWAKEQVGKANEAAASRERLARYFPFIESIEGN